MDDKKIPDISDQTWELLKEAAEKDPYVRNLIMLLSSAIKTKLTSDLAVHCSPFAILCIQALVIQGDLNM